MSNKTFSLYDEKYFTEDEKKYLSDVKRRAEAGETDWESAHAEFERHRARYGYSGGDDGSKYIRLDSGTPDSFGRMETPKYESPYKKETEELKNALLSQEEFTYDHKNDPAYLELERAYTKGAQRAMDDTLGKISARTGGIASSYAGQVAQETYNDHMDDLSDKVTALREAAYQKHLTEKEQKRSDLNTLLALESNHRNNYTDDVALDRQATQFNYGVYRDEKNDKTAEIAQAWNEAKEKALLGDFSGFETLGVDTTRYQSDFEYQKKVEDAFNRWSVGDPSGLIDLGYNLDNFYADKEKAEQDAAKAQALEEAAIGASLGDFSGYRDLGFDPSRAEAAYGVQSTPSVTKEKEGENIPTMHLDDAVEIIKNSTFTPAAVNALFANGWDYASIKSLNPEVGDQGLISLLTPEGTATLERLKVHGVNKNNITDEQLAEIMSLDTLDMEIIAGYLGLL